MKSLSYLRKVARSTLEASVVVSGLSLQQALTGVQVRKPSDKAKASGLCTARS